jgi:hypothetical protein
MAPASIIRVRMFFKSYTEVVTTTRPVDKKVVSSE